MREAMMRGNYFATVVLILLITSGCGHYGALTKDYGNSYNMAKSGQILNPGASKNLKPVTGLPGIAADATMKSYAASFAAPSGQAGQAGQAPSALLMTPLSLGAGKDVYGK
jgi:hypothetical protein